MTADSLFAALTGRFDQFTADLYRPLSRRMFGTLDAAVRLYPEDPELWYELGEVRFHLGWMVHANQSQMLDAFDHAIALDSSFTPAYVHSTSLALGLYGVEGWDRYARPYLASGRSDDYSAGTRLLNAILKSNPAQPGSTDSLLHKTGLDQLLDVTFTSWHFSDSAETGIRLARAVVASRRHSAGFADEPAIRRQVLAGVLGFRGHLREAQRLLGSEDQPGWNSAWPAEIALAGGNSPDSADAMFDRWLRRGFFWPPGEWPAAGPPGPLMFALPWWSARRDTLALAEYIRRADSVQRAASRPLWREIAQYGGEAGRAYSALARGDTAAAVRRFAALPHDAYWGSLDRVAEGQILASLGRDRDALKLFEEAFPNDWWGPARVLAKLDAARAAERLGQRERASGAYQFVLDAWRHADPELEPYVREARTGLGRLIAEPRR